MLGGGGVQATVASAAAATPVGAYILRQYVFRRAAPGAPGAEPGGGEAEEGKFEV